ncbi:oligosaccharide flippase family protein, partial [Blautia sp. MB18-30]|uniref:oligosaccharide flippase family protein n=1 Tax=Blautia sp. MB18-30 TaxID=2949744 RepID=UPI0020305195
YNIRRHLKPIIVFFLFSVATMIYTSLDTVMLGFMSNDIQVGYYNAATKMKNILVSLVTSLGVVLLPRASYYIENNFENDFIRVIKKAFQFVIASAIPISIFFMIEAKDTILFLAGKEYRNAIPSMIIIIPTVFFIGLSNIIGMQIFIPIGLEKLTVFSTFVGALIDYY